MATLMPSTLPRSFAGNAAVRMAMAVLNIMALPNPSIALDAMSMSMEPDIAQSIEDRTTTVSPITKMVFLPIISAIRPKGTTKMAAVSRKPRTTHWSMAWSVTAKSVLMVGIATFTEDARKGVINADIQVMISMMRLSVGEDIKHIEALFL